MVSIRLLDIQAFVYACAWALMHTTDDDKRQHGGLEMLAPHVHIVSTQQTQQGRLGIPRRAPINPKLTILYGRLESRRQQRVPAKSLTHAY